MSGDETPAKTRAVALQYDHPGVPVVTAKGEGAFARRIIEEACGGLDGAVKLHVEYDNPAKRLYERIGFSTKYAEMRYTP